MSDQYERHRSLSFRAIANALGIDLEHFKTRKGKHGPEMYGPCPLHGPKNNTTSFSYSESGLWHCFSCNKHGRGAIDFIKELRQCGFQEAVDFLTVVEPLPTPKTAAPAVSDATDGILKPLDKDSWRKFAVPCRWLEQRIPDAGIRERYGVFCYNNPARKSAYSGRVMIPIKDSNGVLYGYLGRSTSQDDSVPKYLFPKNLPKSRFLFGSHELGSFGPAPLKRVYLVESPFCVMRLAALGLPAVSPFGWSVSDEQIELLTTLTKGVVYLPDSNKAQDAVQCAGTLARRLWCRFPALSAACEDPETLDLPAIQALTK